MTTFDWKISQLNRQAADGFVTQVHYRVEAKDGAYFADTYGAVAFEPTEESFAPFDSLTEADVIGWVQTKLDQSAVETSLQTQIDAQKTPATLTGVPWTTREPA
jgi:hypothetical protein